MEQGEARRRTLYLSLVALAVVYLAYLARAAVVPLVVALILAYVLSPVVAALQRRGVSRMGAVVMLFVAFFGTGALAIVFGIPPLVQEGKALVRAGLGEPAFTVGLLPPPPLADLLARQPAASLEEYLRARGAIPAAPGDPGRAETEGNWERQVREAQDTGGEEAVKDLRRRVGAWKVAGFQGRAVVFHDTNDDGRLQAGFVLDLALRVGSYIREHLKTPAVANAVEDLAADIIPHLTGAFLSADAARGALGLLGTVLGILTWAFIVPLYTFFFLMHLQSVWNAFVSYLPGAYRDRVVKVLTQIHRMLIGFFRGRLLTMVLKGLFVGLGLGIVGAPFWAVFGAAAGMLTIVPAVGPLAAGVPAVVLAYREDGALVASLAAAVLLASEFVEGYILLPKIVGKEVGLHPMAVITAIFIGGALLGMFGIVIAIPLAAAAKIVWTEFVLPALRAKAAEEPRPPGGAVP